MPSRSKNAIKLRFCSSLLCVGLSVVSTSFPEPFEPFVGVDFIERPQVKDRNLVGGVSAVQRIGAIINDLDDIEIVPAITIVEPLPDFEW